MNIFVYLYIYGHNYYHMLTYKWTLAGFENENTTCKTREETLEGQRDQVYRNLYRVIFFFLNLCRSSVVLLQMSSRGYWILLITWKLLSLIIEDLGIKGFILLH